LVVVSSILVAVFAAIARKDAEKAEYIGQRDLYAAERRLHRPADIRSIEHSFDHSGSKVLGDI